MDEVVFAAGPGYYKESYESVMPFFIDSQNCVDPEFKPPSVHSVVLLAGGCDQIWLSSVNCAGLMAVIRWLLVRDFEVVTFLPVIYNNAQNFNATHVYLLPVSQFHLLNFKKLEELRVVTFTPARTARGDRRAFINYDDLYVATLAARHGGVVLSGDRFKDIICQPQYSDLHEVLRHRRLDVRFNRLTHEHVQIEHDRYIDRVPELFLREFEFCTGLILADAHRRQVILRRETWTPEFRDRTVAAIDLLMDELCERAGKRPNFLTPPIHQYICLKSPNSRSSNQNTTRRTSISSDSSDYSSNKPSIIQEVARFVQCEFPLREPSSRSSSPSSTQCSNFEVESDDELPFADAAKPRLHELAWQQLNLFSLSFDDLLLCSESRAQIPLAAEETEDETQSELSEHNDPQADDEFECAAKRQLGLAFPDEVVAMVLHENASRNLEVLANACAEMLTP